MIEFIEVQSKESLGTVELTDGKLQASPVLQSMVDSWLRQEKTPEAFMEFYGGDGWSNGYIYSQDAKGKPAEDVPAEPSAEELRTRAFAKSGSEELSPVAVVEKLRDLVAEDVDGDPERGYAGVEAKEQMDNYVELITEAVADGDQDDVHDIIEDILEEVPIEDYDGAEDIVQFLKGFLGQDEMDEDAVPQEPAKEEPVKTLRFNFPRPIKKK